jgi:hypothetical protein
VPVTLVIDSLRLQDQWETLEIVGLNGKLHTVQNIRNQSRVLVSVSRLGKGMHIAVLRKKDGKAVYLKFIKI